MKHLIKSRSAIFVTLTIALVTFVSSGRVWADAAVENDTTLEKFSYCSNGNCKLIDGGFFNRNRGMPTDLNVTCKKNNQYALTFDDGPSANYPRLLEILKRNNVKATFFVVGNNVANETAAKWFAQAFRDGHFMANHTFTHASLTELSEAQVYEQVEKSQEFMLKAVFPKENPSAETNADLEAFKALQFSTKFVRPPFGNINANVDNLLKARGFISIRWNADRYDWQLSGTDPTTPGIIVQRVIQQLDFIKNQINTGVKFNSSILDLNHDWQNTTLDALDTWIPIVKKSGYEFVTMDQCLNLSPS